MILVQNEYKNMSPTDFVQACQDTQIITDDSSLYIFTVQK